MSMSMSRSMDINTEEREASQSSDIWNELASG